jgi:hypothetical protein
LQGNKLNQILFTQRKQKTLTNEGNKEKSFITGLHKTYLTNRIFSEIRDEESMERRRKKTEEGNKNRVEKIK